MLNRALYLETMERCQVGTRRPLVEVGEAAAEEDQLSLAVLAMVLNESQQARSRCSARRREAGADQEGKAHTRRAPTGRQPLPEFLPRVEFEMLPPEVEKKGLDAFDRIGGDTSETIERPPAATVVVRIVRPKFLPKDRERGAITKVSIAPPLKVPIPKGSPGRACSPIRS